MSREYDPGEEKPCKACTDFKTWTKLQGKAPPPKPEPSAPAPECPLDKDDLGRQTWGFLHSMAAYYPEKPTTCQSAFMSKFFHIFAQFYPCEHCALDFQEDIKENPPVASTREELEKWLCERHNVVNVKLGKPVFDCSKVHERWREGWKDGSCD